MLHEFCFTGSPAVITATGDLATLAAASVRETVAGVLDALAVSYRLDEAVPWCVLQTLRLPRDVFSPSDLRNLARHARNGSRRAASGEDPPYRPGIPMRQLIWRLGEYLDIDHTIDTYLRDQAGGLASAVRAAIADEFHEMHENELVELAEHERVAAGMLPPDLAA